MGIKTHFRLGFRRWYDGMMDRHLFDHRHNISRPNPQARSGVRETPRLTSSTGSCDLAAYPDSASNLSCTHFKGGTTTFQTKRWECPLKKSQTQHAYSLIIWTLQLKNVQFFYRLHSVSNPAWKPADSIWLKINVRSRAAFQYTGLLQMHPRFPKIPTGSGLSYSRFWVFHQESEREGWLSRE